MHHLTHVNFVERDVIAELVELNRQHGLHKRPHWLVLFPCICVEVRHDCKGSAERNSNLGTLFYFAKTKTNDNTILVLCNNYYDI